MRVQRERIERAGLSLALMFGLLGGTSTLAQTAAQKSKVPEKVQREVLVEEHDILIAPEASSQTAVRVQAPEIHPADVAASDKTFVFLSTEMSLSGKLVKGAPYSAEAVTETTQTLADGNRIVHKNTANVYRDSEGRTRREHTLRGFGPFAVGGEPPQTFFINDPVAGVNYVLDPRTRTARKMTPPRVSFSRDTLPPDAAKRLEKELKAAGVKMKDDVTEFTMAVPATPAPGMAPPPMLRYHQKNDENAKKESLGTRNINGVQAEGTRTTVTIPAGEVGNELPINMVFERWYSPELQLVVMSKHSDPRFGETVYSLNNINRSEPARSLFEVPADYTVKEGPPAIRNFMRKPREREKEEK